MTRLIAYLGEREGAHEDLLESCVRAGVEKAVLLRGFEGFGARHHLHTERLLTLSEDLPLVVVALGERAALESALDGAHVALATLDEPRPVGDGPARLTVWCARATSHRAVVARLRAAGADGATVLLGVDGVIDGERRRGRFLGDNRDVPKLVVAVGRAEPLAAVAAETGGTLAGLGGEPRDGWWRVTAYTSAARPAAARALRELRAAGAAGATTLHGVWGYRGSAPPHGDRVLALRRHVPAVVDVVDRAEPARRWLELLRGAGLVTAEPVALVRSGVASRA